MRKIRAALGFILILGLLIGCGPKEGTLEYFIDNLDARKSADRIKAVKEIARLAEEGAPGVNKAVQPIIQFFKDNVDDEAKEQAAIALGKLRDKSAVGTMCEWLTESAKIDQTKVNNRSRALALGLGEIGDPSAIDTLLKVVESSAEDSVKRTAITALGKLKAVKAVDSLIKVVLDDGENLLTRQRAILALGDIGDAKAADALVYSLFVEDRGISLNEYANKAIHRLGPAAVPKLIETLQGKNQKVIDYIKLHPSWPKGVMENKAMLTLGDLGDQRATEHILKAMEERDYQILGSMALMFLQDKKAVPKLVELTKKYKTGKIQFGEVQQISSALSKIYAPEESIPVFFDVAGAELEKYAADFGRFQIMMELSKLVHTPEQCDKWLEMAKKDIDKDAQKWYEKEGKPRVEAAKECGLKYDCWAKKLQDKDPFVRERAVLELGRSGDVKYLDTLLGKPLEDGETCVSGYRLCEACPPIQSICVREAMVDALLKLGPKDPKKAVDALEKRLEEDKNRSTFKKVGFRYSVVRWFLKHKIK